MVLVGCRIARGDGRKIIGLCLTDDRDGRVIGLERLFDALVGNLDLAQKRRELGVVIDRPPFAAIKCIARIDDLSAFGLLEMRRDRRGRPHVVGAHSAAAEGRRSEAGDGQADARQAIGREPVQRLKLIDATRTTKALFRPGPRQPSSFAFIATD